MLSSTTAEATIIPEEPTAAMDMDMEVEAEAVAVVITDRYMTS